MERSLAVLIISSYPIVAWAVEQILRSEARTIHCQIVPDIARPRDSKGIEPAITIIAPQTWEEMRRWRPFLGERHADCRWMMYSRLRIAGMFLSFLRKAPLCTILSTTSSPEQFRNAFTALVTDEALCPPKALLALFMEGLPPLPGGRQALPLTLRELECACAVSLGLTNDQIATALEDVDTETVKKHIGRARSKLHQQTRTELGILVEQALFRSTTTS